MSDEKYETIADIVAEKRREAEYIIESAEASAESGETIAGTPFTKTELNLAREDARMIREEADRLEAAHGRELSKICPKTGGDFGQLGDYVKLREALKAAKKYLDGYTVNILELRRTVDAALAAPARNCDVGRDTLSSALEQVNKVYDILSRPCVCLEEARQGCREARGVLIPALAAPPRNCGAGTAEEQVRRRRNYCKSVSSCDHCKSSKVRDKTGVDCFARWAQLPYESEATDGK